MPIPRSCLRFRRHAGVFAILTVAAPVLSSQASDLPISQRIVGFESDAQRPFAAFDVDARPAPFQGPSKFAPRLLWLAGRDAVDRCRPDLAQQVSDIDGVSSVILPDGGRLVRYLRRGQNVAGLFHVTAAGFTRTLLEVPLSFSGTMPLQRWIAVSPFEPVAAVATSADTALRGDVFLLRLDGGNFPGGGAARLVTSSLPAADVGGASMTFVQGALFCVHADTQLLRIPSDGSTDAVRVPLPASGGQAPVEVSAELAVSADGSTVAFLAGQTEKIWDLYVASAAGAVTNLTQKPSQYQPVGHLPDLRGPYLALSPDGAHVVYADENPDIEFFRRDTAGLAAPVQLTSDALFEPSIDDGSSIISRSAFVMMSLGENAAAKDTYRFTFNGGGGVNQVANMTGTSGGVGVPWNTGAQLDPAEVLATADAGAVVLVDDRTPQVGSPTFDLWTFGSTGARLQAQDLPQSPELMIAADAPSRWAVHWSDALGPHLGTLGSDPTAPLQDVITGVPGIEFRGLSLRPDGAEVSMTASAGPGFDTVVSVDLGSGGIRFLTPLGGFGGAQTRYSPSGHVLFSFGLTPTLQGFVRLPTGATAPIGGATGTPWFY